MIVWGLRYLDETPFLGSVAGEYRLAISINANPPVLIVTNSEDGIESVFEGTLLELLLKAEEYAQ